jgi:hypothetical protein
MPVINGSLLMLKPGVVLPTALYRPYIGEDGEIVMIPYEVVPVPPVNKTVKSRLCRLVLSGKPPQII